MRMHASVPRPASLLVPLALALGLAACEASLAGTGDGDETGTDGTSEGDGDPGDGDMDGDAGDGDMGDGDTLDDLPAPELPEALLDYDPDLPAHFRTAFVDGMDNTPADNPITNAGATLGRVLFWDRRLSQNGAVSCGSCHRPELGFSDELEQSEGFAGDHTRRNSMSLINLRWYEREAMFWDERAATLEDQVLMPIQDEAEMGLTLEELVARVEDADYYAPLFEAAFGTPDVSEERIAAAMAQFVRSIVSYQSRWDAGVTAVAGDIALDFPNFSDAENRGKRIFFGQHDPDTRGLCGTCHLQANPLSFAPPGPGPTPVFDNTAVFFQIAPSNNGLLDDDDDGVGETTGIDQDLGKFKVSSLRNVALTGPYMHDGRFATLEEVVAHYNDGVQAHPNLDPALREIGPGGGPLRLDLDAGDQAALVAFMRTLTDETLASDERWSDPFPRD